MLDLKKLQYIKNNISDLYLLDNILFDFSMNRKIFDLNFVLNNNFNLNVEKIVYYLNLYKLTDNKKYLLKSCYLINDLIKYYSENMYYKNYINHFELVGFKKFNKSY